MRPQLLISTHATNAQPHLHKGKVVSTNASTVPDIIYMIVYIDSIYFHGCIQVTSTASGSSYIVHLATS